MRPGIAPDNSINQHGVIVGYYLLLLSVCNSIHFIALLSDDKHRSIFAVVLRPGLGNLSQQHLFTGKSRFSANGSMQSTA